MNKIVAVTAAAAVPVALPSIGSGMTPDPIFAALESFRIAEANFRAHSSGDIPDEVGDQWTRAVDNVIRTRPTTPAGLCALTGFAREMTRRAGNDATFADRQWLPVMEAIDDATRGMAGLAIVPAGAALPAMASTTGADAELIALGKKLEGMVDTYYAARQPWALALCQYNAELEKRFGDPAERNYRDTPEIKAASEEVENRVGLRKAGDQLSAVHEEIEPIAEAISSLPCTSIEGLRAKALVAFWEVAPLCASDAEFHFEDAYPFQHLFRAVAELCGLNGKIAATGFKMPDDYVEWDDDGEEDEGEDA